MLIKIFFMSDDGVMHISEFSNKNHIFSSRVEHHLVPNPHNPDGPMIAASDGSLTLKFETPMHRMAHEEARVALYNLYRELVIQQGKIYSIEIYNNDILILNTRSLGLKPTNPLMIDTAFNPNEAERDVHVIVQVDLLWDKEI